jgi:hypothetical protein
LAGASTADTLEALIRGAGFEQVCIEVKPESRAFISQWMPGTGAENHVASATIEARKPGVASACCGPSCCSPKEPA